MVEQEPGEAFQGLSMMTKRESVFLGGEKRKGVAEKFSKLELHPEKEGKLPLDEPEGQGSDVLVEVKGRPTSMCSLARPKWVLGKLKHPGTRH